MRRALLALVLAASACGPVGKEQERVLYRRLEGEPQTLNPVVSTSDPDLVVIALLQRNLLDYDEKLNLVPGLAESVEPDPAHLVYTIRLREGARWEDGTPISSDDVKATLEAIVDPKTPALYRKSFFADLEKVETVDARTARATFRRAYPAQRDAFNLPLLPAKLYRGTDVASNPANRKPLASGPFRLASWEGGTLRLVRNTQYFGDPPAFEQVVFRTVPESASAVQGLLAGALDESRLTAVQRKEAAASGHVREFVYDELAYTYFAWNNRLPQFDDARVRRALTMLTDREAIARSLYGGLARPANGRSLQASGPTTRRSRRFRTTRRRPPRSWTRPASGRGRTGSGPGAPSASRSPSRTAPGATGSDRSRSSRSARSARRASRWSSRRWSGGPSSTRSTPATTRPARCPSTSTRTRTSARTGTPRRSRRTG